MINYDLVIVGGGAGGLFSAITAAQTNNNIKILILEKLNRVGKKIMVSGNGRCNLSNNGKYTYYGDAEFANIALGENASKFIVSIFNEMGLATIVDSENRVYPASNNASTVMDIFLLNLKRHNIDIKTECEVLDIKANGKSFILKTNTDSIYAKKIIISTGGKSSPKHGSDGKLLNVLYKLGFKSTSLYPALVPICTETDFIKGLSGLRLKAKISAKNVDFKGEILFTDYGISGIPSMQLSRFCTKGDIINVDLRYGAALEGKDQDAIIEIINDRVKKYPNESVDTLLTGLFTNRIGLAILKYSGIYHLTLKNKQLSNKQIISLAQTLFSIKLKVIGTKGFEFSQVTAGGLECSQFNPKTMESNNINGLYCVGEVLNVDGDCGGYNLLFAFKTGYNAGVSAAKSLNL